MLKVIIPFHLLVDSIMRRSFLRLTPKTSPTSGPSKGGKTSRNESLKKFTPSSMLGKTKVEEIYSRLKNPRTEGEAMARSIAIGVGICCIGIFTSIIGLR